MTGKQLCRKGLGGPGGHQFDMNHQCVLAAKMTDSLLGYERKSIAKRLREVILPLYPAWWGSIRSAVSTSGVLGTRDMMYWSEPSEGPQR